MIVTGFAPWAPDHVTFPQAPFKRLMRPVVRPLSGSEEIVTAYRDGVVTARSKRRLTGYTEAADLSSYQRVEIGDLVVHGLDILAGAVGVSDSDGAVSPVCTTCVPIGGADPRYVSYVIRAQAATGFTQAMARGIRQRSADFRRWETLADLPVPSPPPNEQRRIADYLDAECRRIEPATASLRRAADLLAERARSRLEETVLLPQGPHQPANGEWPSPVDWQRRSLVSLASKFVDGDWIEAPYITDHGTRLLQTGNVGIGEFREKGGRSVSDQTFDDLRCTEVRPTDVLICRLASPVGRACIAPDLGVRMITSVDVTIMRCGPEVEPAFVAAVLSTSSWLSRMAAEEQGSTRARIARTRLGEFRIPVPDIRTQNRIAADVQERRAEVTAATDRLKQEARLLAERRDALITAAVTGTIQV